MESLYSCRQDPCENLGDLVKSYKQLINEPAEGKPGMMTCRELKNQWLKYIGEYEISRRRCGDDTAVRVQLSKLPNTFNVIGFIRALKDYEENGKSYVDLVIFDPSLMTDTCIRLRYFSGRLRSGLVPGDIALLRSIEITSEGDTAWSLKHKISTRASSEILVIKAFSEDYSSSNFRHRCNAELFAKYPWIIRIAQFLEDFAAESLLRSNQLPVMKHVTSEYRDLVGMALASKVQHNYVILYIRTPHRMDFASQVFPSGFDFKKQPILQDSKILWDIVNKKHYISNLEVPKSKNPLAIHVWAPSPHNRFAAGLPFDNGNNFYVFLNVNIRLTRNPDRDSIDPLTETSQTIKAQCHMRSRLCHGTCIRPIGPDSILAKRLMGILADNT